MIKDLKCSGEINRFQTQINRFFFVAESKFQIAHTPVEFYAAEMILTILSSKDNMKQINSHNFKITYHTDLITPNCTQDRIQIEILILNLQVYVTEIYQNQYQLRMSSPMQLYQTQQFSRLNIKVINTKDSQSLQ